MKLNMNKLYFAFLFLISMNSIGQHALPIQMDTLIYNYEIISTGILDYGSTSIKNEMTKKLLYGGFIDSEMKDRSLNSHKTQNRIGIEASSEIEFRDYKTRLFKQGKYGYYIRAGYYNYATSAYSQDIFDLVFNGNSYFLGDTANFSGTQANAISFQKIGFGFIDKKSKSNIGVNYYNVTSLSDAYIRTGNLIMDSAGSNIELDMGGEFRYSEGEKFNKGWGLGLDADFRIPVKWLNESQAYIQVQLKNIGFMSVKNMTVYTADKSYNFSGFKFSELLGDSGTSIKDGNQLLDTLGIEKRSENITTLLPGFIQIGKVVDAQSNNNVQSYFGVRLHTSLNYTPLVFAGAHFKLYDWMKVGIQGSYGGFSNFRLGFYSQYDLGKFHFGIGSEDLIGALTKKGYGESIHFRITRLW
jgi:hypothetical protein